MTMYTQVQVPVTQQPNYQRPPPPSQFPVPPTYPTSGYASAIPRFEPIAPQLEMRHVNYTRPPVALPQVARAPSAHPPPYFHGASGQLSGRPDISEAQYPPATGPSYGGRGPSYELVRSHAPERPHPQLVEVYVGQTA
jgi:hypothetical protein